MVFYLKYRPQKFSELDIKLVRERLINIFSSGRVPHAFLFSGPKGTGKTSAARIVAKVVNCERKAKKTPPRWPESASWRRRDSSDGGGMRKRSFSEVEFEPCNQCESCQAITAGRHLDILEIDAASNRGIDEIRTLRERIKLAPSQAKYKVYIIDEVHMLTIEAFNALLKTLEEPPKHAIFILATTRVDKLPETITSRCLRIDFKKAAQEEIVRSLRRIVEGEKLEVEKKVLEFIAGEADGSFREAAKILEEASLQPKAVGQITLERVKKLLGKDKDFSQKDLLEWLVKRDTKRALEWLSDVGEKGGDFRVLTESLLEKLHGMLMKKFGVDNHEKIETLKHKNNQLTVEELKELIRLFSRAYQELKTAVIPSLPLELAIIEWCEASQGNTSEVARSVSEGTPRTVEELPRGGRVERSGTPALPAGRSASSEVEERSDDV